MLVVSCMDVALINKSRYSLWKNFWMLHPEVAGGTFTHGFGWCQCALIFGEDATVVFVCSA